MSPLKMYTDKDLLALSASGDPINQTLAGYKAIQDMFSGKTVTTANPPALIPYDSYLLAQVSTIEGKNAKKIQHFKEHFIMKCSFCFIFSQKPLQIFFHKFHYLL